MKSNIVQKENVSEAKPEKEEILSRVVYKDIDM